MTHTFATALNTAGQTHVASEIERLGLGWDVDSTLTEIEGEAGFGDLVQHSDDVCYYEISNNQAAQAGVGSAGHGVFATIEILADVHVQFELST